MASVTMCGALLLLLACRLQVPELPERSDGADSLLLVVHGGGDDPGVWAESMADTLDSALVEPDRWDIVPLDWSADADNAMTSARRGRRIGEALAPEVEARGYERLHVIAHSVGAHVGHGLVVERPRAIRQLTLLDPFAGSGLVRWGYGRDRFGDGADFGEAYINTDDGVPSTDGDFEGLHVFDVTALRPSSLVTPEEGHRWPITWYEDSERSGVGIDLALGVDGTPWELRDAFPPGQTTTL